MVVFDVLVDYVVFLIVVADHCAYLWKINVHLRLLEVVGEYVWVDMNSHIYVKPPTTVKFEVRLRLCWGYTNKG